MTPIISNSEVPYAALVGQVIKIARSERGLQQYQVAGCLGISQSGYSRLERGDSMWNAWHLHQCAQFMGMTTSELLLRIDHHEWLLKKQGFVIVEVKQEHLPASFRGVLLQASFSGATSSRS